VVEFDFEQKVKYFPQLQGDSTLFFYSTDFVPNENFFYE